MPAFEYRALDGDGKRVTGTLKAAGRTEAIAALAERRIFVTDIQAGAGAPAATAAAQDTPAPARGFFTSGRIRPRVRAAMLRQLATALQAGLPILCSAFS